MSHGANSTNRTYIYQCPLSYTFRQKKLSNINYLKLMVLDMYQAHEAALTRKILQLKQQISTLLIK